MRLDLSDLKTLSLFNEKVGKLWKSSFADEVFYNETGFMVYADRKETSELKVSKIEVKAPKQESIDAFLLTFRLFIQDNDKISIHNISKIYDNSHIPPQMKADFNAIRKKLNDYLEKANEICPIDNGSTLSNETIMRTMIYGDLAHLNDKKREIYDRWMKSYIDKIVKNNEFIVILAETLNGLTLIHFLNEDLIMMGTDHLIPSQLPLRRIDLMQVRSMMIPRY